MILRYFTLLCFITFISFSTRAQTFNQVTATNNGFQIINGITVQAQRTGFGFCQGKYLNGPFCGVGPYFIGDCGRNGWRYQFFPAVTHIRIHMASLHDDDTIRIYLGATMLQMKAGNLSAWASACNPSIFKAVTTPAGDITASGAPNGFSDVQIDFNNQNISDIRVEHRRSFGNTTADGVVFDMAFAHDTCKLDFETSVDSPQCSGKPVKLHATNFPNTTYSWTGPNGFTSTSSDPILPNGHINMNGTYTCVATRGNCTFQDDVVVFVDQTPVISSVVSQGPTCPGDNDTLSVFSFQASYEWTGPNGFASASPRPVLSNIQKSDEGTYCVIAKSLTNGCISDKKCVDVKVNDPAHAKFDYEEVLGCTADTIKFRNLSTNATNAAWSFGDGNVSNALNPVHPYISATMPAAYTVKLTVGNGNCSDDTFVNIVFNHPLLAAFTFDDDSICQNTIVNFTNNSIAAPATLPSFAWSMGDGNSYNLPNIAHEFKRPGVYNTSMIITDYLGCKDTATHVFVVDSVGSVNYDFSGDVLCLGNTVSFDGYYSPWGINGVTWNMGDGTIFNNISKLNYTYDKAGTFTVRYTADYRICPSQVFEKIISVKPFPVIDLGPDRTICPNGNPVVLTDKVNEANPGASWKWNTEVINNAASLKVFHPGTYAATVEVDGCASSDSVVVAKDCYINVPNAFTPNGDGSDDYFLPKELMSRGLARFSMTIFNRWGEVVFRTNSNDGRGWDGKYNDKPQATGVYVYLIDASFVNGESEKYQGNLTLLR